MEDCLSTAKDSKARLNCYQLSIHSFPACRFILDQRFTCWPIPNTWECSKFSMAKMMSQITQITWQKRSACSFPSFPPFQECLTWDVHYRIK